MPAEPEAAFARYCHDRFCRLADVLAASAVLRAVTDVAAESNLSVSTISTHLTNIKTKLRVRSIGEVLNYAHRVGVAE